MIGTQYVDRPYPERISEDLVKSLCSKWNPEVERCGIVLLDGEVVELPNVWHEPERGFGILHEDVAPYIAKHGIDYFLGVWHTHPSNTCHPSELDRIGWISIPGVRYFIVTESEVAEWANPEHRLH